MLKKGLVYNKTRQIGEHLYEKPPLPKDNNEILFYYEKPENAHWLRLELPKVFYDFVPNYTELYQEASLMDDKGVYKSFNQDDSDLFINTLKQELDRRENGIFFRNGNEIEYITGHHYFTIQHCRCYGKTSSYDRFVGTFGAIITKDEFHIRCAEYGFFYKYQQDVFYLIDLVWRDVQILGAFISKAKKTGVTFLFSCYLLNKTTLYKMQQVGIMSMSKDVAIDSNMMYFYHAFDGLPNIFKPSVKTDARSEGHTVFGAKTFSGASSHKAALNSLMQDKALNSRIFVAPTDPKGFDSPKMTDVVLDEFNKMFAKSNQSPKKIFETNNATVKMQNDIEGKMWLFGYVSEQNDIGVHEAREIFFDSKLHTKKGARRTNSELICYHVSSLYSYLSLIDKYGDCNEKAANEDIEAVLSKVKSDPKKYLSVKRQLARTEKEAWEIGGVSSTFNPLPIINQIDVVAEDIRNGVHNMVAGRLFWDNTVWEMGKKDKRPKGAFTKVRFVRLTEDDIINGIEPDFWIDEDYLRTGTFNEGLTRGTDSEGNLLPPRRFNNVGGADTVKWAEAVQEGSKCAYGTMSIYDAIKDSRARKIASKKIVSIYWGRPDNPREAYEQLIKETIFFSKLQIVEANEPTFVNMMLQEGLGYYLIFKDSKAKTFSMIQYDTWMELGVDFNFIYRTKSGSQNTVLETIIRAAKDYLWVGDNEPNYVETINFIPLLKQFLDFDPEQTKPSDLVMMFGYMTLAHDFFMSTILGSSNEKEDSVLFHSFVQALKK
jgi:hypothetical protein